MAIDKAALLAKVKAAGEDQTKVQEFKGGEDIPEGTHRARFVGYVEVGKHVGTYQGKPKTKADDNVTIVFEISGPRVPAREDGSPVLKSITLNKSMNEKAAFFKLMQRMNYAGKATHMAELLGSAYLIGVYHITKGEGEAKRTYVNLRKKGEPYDIRPPRKEDLETGEFVPVEVAPAVSPEKCFLWDFADMEQWNSLFIEGEYPERKDDKGVVTRAAKSKNVFQNTIKLAKNFSGSPIHALLSAGGKTIDIPDAESGVERDEGDDDTPDVTAAVGTKPPVETPVGAAADDALAGVA